MLLLFISVTLLKNLEAFNSAVYLFNVNPVTPKPPVIPFLISAKFGISRLLIRRQAVCVIALYTLITFITYEQYIFQEMIPAVFENLKIVYRPFLFVYADNFTAPAVYYQLVFYLMPFFLPEYDPF